MQEYTDIPDIATFDKNCIFVVLRRDMSYNGKNDR